MSEERAIPHLARLLGPAAALRRAQPPSRPVTWRPRAAAASSLPFAAPTAGPPTAPNQTPSKSGNLGIGAKSGDLNIGAESGTLSIRSALELRSFGVPWPTGTHHRRQCTFRPEKATWQQMPQRHEVRGSNERAAAVLDRLRQALLSSGVTTIYCCKLGSSGTPGTI